MKILYSLLGLSLIFTFAFAEKESKVYLNFNPYDVFSFNKFSVGTLKHISIEEQDRITKDFKAALAHLQDFADQVHNIGKKGGKSAKEVFRLDRPDININKQCYHDMEQLGDEAALGVVYALKIIDAWGTTQSGIYEGNVRWPGSFYQCRNTKGANISGKYYTTFYGFKFEPAAATYPIDIAYAGCFPDSCDNYTASKLMPKSFPNLPLLKTVDSDLQNTYTPSTIISIVISVLFLAWALIGTSYHLYCTFFKIENAQRNKILMCSSVLENLEKICSVKKIPGAIPTLDGIRVISTAWVILGHTYVFMGNNVDNTVPMGDSLIGSFFYMVVLNGTFSVDTFFCIGGLLVCYLTLKQLQKPQGMAFIPMMYLKRYLRLTPTYAYLILFSVGLYKYFGDGPYWKYAAEKAQDLCSEYWWSNLLYFSTLYPISNPCFGWGWYLSDDMLFYLLSPFIVLLMTINIHLGVMLACSLILGNIGIVAWMTADRELAPSGIWSPLAFNYWYRLYVDSTYEATWADKFHGDIYYIPWTRIAPYLIGMIAGSILFYNKRKIKMSKVVVFLGWLISTAFAILIVYGFYGSVRDKQVLSHEMNIFYNTMSRPIWGVCVAWVVIACTCGYGGPVTTLLELPLFKPLSKLTFSAYLVHPLVLFWYSATQEQPVHFSEIVFTYLYIGNLTMSFMVAFVVALFVEWPMQEIVKLILPKRQSSGPTGNRVDSRAPEVTMETDVKMADMWSSSSGSSAPPYSEAAPYVKKEAYENEAYVSIEHDTVKKVSTPL